MSDQPRDDVRIRVYAADDLALLERLLGDPRMMLHLGGPETPEALLARHARYLGCDGSTEGVFTIVVDPDHAVGWVGYWESSWVGEAVWEVGWNVVPESQGAGVAYAAALLMLERARTHDPCRPVHAFPSVENAASNALCGRLGFELRGEVQVEYPKGHMMSCNDWCLDLEGLPSARQGAVPADAP